MLPRHLQDHTYATTRDIYVDINQQYADDISWATNVEHKIEKIKKTIPSQLKNYNLHINESKTEEYKIGRDGPEDWKKCKYLGTLLYTGSDIIRRKGLAISAFNKLNHIFKNKKLSTRLKVRVFNAYVASIFLYNSELWTMTTALEHKLNTFQRSLLRKLLNIRWPQTISNRNLYEQTNEILWSKKIKSRRLSWLGHLLRLPEDTPARQALAEAQRQVRRPRGRPKTTWISAIQKELKEIHEDLNLLAATEKAQDRTLWMTIIEGAMSNDEERT